MTIPHYGETVEVKVFQKMVYLLVLKPHQQIAHLLGKFSRET